MIVQCASCQTRFKIGDDKVTERGVKVRCAKCATVFVVRKGDGAAAPATGLPVPSTGLPRPEIPTPAPAAAPANAPAAQVARAPAGKSRPPPPPPGLLDDLFGQLDLGGGAGAPAAVLPPAAPGGPSPDAVFGSPPPASAAATTGLESLFPAEAGVGTEPRPPVAEALVSTPAPARSIVSALDSLPAPKPSDPFEAALASTLDLALAPLGAPAGPPPAQEIFSPGAGPAPGAGGSFEDPLAGLDLDAPSSPQLSSPAAPAPLPPGGDAGSEFDLSFGLGEDGPAGPLPGGSEPREAPPPTAPAPPVPAPEPAARSPAVTHHVAATIPAPSPEERSLFSLVFNAVAFVALVAVILLAFVIYRNGGKVDLHELGSGLRVAFGLSATRGGAPDLPLRVTGSGYYPTATGGSLLFVTGTVENAGSAPQRLAVDLDVVDRDGKTVAHGRGWPGRPPTPEDLHAAVSAADLERLVQRLGQDPIALLAPGRTAPFVIAVPRPPQGAEGCTLRVRAHPFGAEAARVPAPPPAERTAITAAAPSGR